MKRFQTIGTAVLLLAAAATLSAADAATELRMGDDAFAAGDYRNAVNFYSSALTLSEANPELWSAAAVKLADARLRTGDVAGAKTLLAEFRRRFPASSAGLLPGEIMIAEHDYTGAEKFFNTLAANSSDPELLCAAKFARAFSKLRQNRDLEAAFDFEEIETQNADLRRWAEQAHLARIYALIRAGKPEEAEKLLAAGKYRSAEPEGYARLGLLSALKQGNFEQFRDHWPQQQEKYGDRPDPLMYELAVEGAALAEKKGDLKFAETLLDAGFRLAGGDLERRNALRALINLQAKISPAAAADTILRGIEFFPEAGDRALLILRGARLLAESGEWKRAVELLVRITGDNRVPVMQRLEAAREASIAARHAGDRETAEKMLQYLTSQAETAYQREEGNYLLGEFYFQEKRIAQAIRHLREAIGKGNGKYADPARFLLLQCLLEQQAYKEAMPIAETLRSSTRPELAAAADYFRAQLLEKSGRRAEARSEYLKFLVAHPKSEYAPAALYSAAELAMELKQFKAAAAEFFRFAAENPKLPAAPPALFLAMQSAYFGRLSADTTRAVELLDRNYLDSPCTIEARLQLADYLRGDGDFERALALLDETEKRTGGKTPEIQAEVLFNRARIHLARGSAAEAGKLLANLLSRYAASGGGADAALLAGNIDSDAGNYASALQHYRRARELRPTGLFAEICDGRIADCRYSLYSESLDRNDLNAATATYRKLAQESGDPRLVLQSLYKLGKCLELGDESDAAIQTYERLLYLAADQKRHGIAPDPVWCGKAAYAAALAHLKAGTPAGARRALRVIDQFEALEFPPTGEDFGRLRERIREKYNLREKL